MIELAIAESDLATLTQGVLSSEAESCAILYAGEVKRLDGLTRLLVREVEFPHSGEYTARGIGHAELHPTAVARASKKARLGNWALVFVHSHPGNERPHFSLTDNRGEVHLAKFLSQRNGGRTHVALVISTGGLRARHIGTKEDVRVISLGEHRTIIAETTTLRKSVSEIFDRQVRAFGSEGQRLMEELTIGVVGLGGTGSVVVQQLVHLGVRKFILLDPDVVEVTNLNRVVNAFSADVGRPKIEIAARYIDSVAANSSVKQFQGDVIHSRAALELTQADLIFGCTDSHGSRSVLQQVAYQYFVPCIDMGTTITVSKGKVSGIFGRVQLLGPGHACLHCAGLLDASEVRRDMMTAFERRLDPYLQGAREPAPAVISLNSTVASLAMTMFMGFVTHIPSSGRYLLYNASTSNLRAVRAEARDNCYICSRAGVYGRANTRDLYARQD